VAVRPCPPGVCKDFERDLAKVIAALQPSTLAEHVEVQLVERGRAPLSKAAEAAERLRALIQDR